jgi:hypothetical protein
MSRLAAASTIPVTNAAKQKNTRRSCRILIMAAFMAASPAPTLVIGPSGMANSRLYKIAPPAIFWCCHAREAGACSGPRMTGVSALQNFAVRGRSHKHSEQFNHTNSDHEHCKCHGIVVQPVQPLLHGTPPCSPTLVSEKDPDTTPPAALAFLCPPGDSARRPVSIGSIRSRRARPVAR